MAKNYIQSDRAITVVAAAAVVSGQPYAQGSIVGIIESDANAGDNVTLNLEGAYDSVPKKAAEAWTKGDQLYFDPATGALSKDNTKVWAGYAFADAQAADVLGAILLKQ